MTDPASTEPLRTRPTTWASLALMAGLVFWMQAGPFTKQILHWKLPYGTMAWQMYHGKGADVCIVDWRRDGASFDPEGPLRRRYHGRKEILRTARELCGGGGDLRADAWCGTRPDGAWKHVVNLEESLCGH